MCFKTLGGLLWITQSCGFPTQLRADSASSLAAPAPSACAPHRAALTQPLQPLTFKSSKAALCTVYSVAGRQQNIGIRRRGGGGGGVAEEAAVNPARLLGTGVVVDDKS